MLSRSRTQWKPSRHACAMFQTVDLSPPAENLRIQAAACDGRGERRADHRAERSGPPRPRAQGEACRHLRRWRLASPPEQRARLPPSGDAVEAAWFGNLVASITVQKKGTGTASPEEVLAAARECSMTTLSIDIGGTKFSMAVFEGCQMVARESRATDREGGREWMLAQILEIGHALEAGSIAWSAAASGSAGLSISRSSVSFCPRTSAAGTISISAGLLASELGVPTHHGQRRQRRRARRERFRRRTIAADPLFYMTLSTGIGGGIITDGNVLRGADSYAGEIGHLTIRPDGPECLCGARGCFERMCCGLWLERDHGKPARDLLQDAGFVETICSGSRAWV